MKAIKKYAPINHKATACQKGEFPIAAVGLAHGHIYSLCEHLEAAGAHVAKVWDRDSSQVKNFLKAFPHCRIASGEQEILDDVEVRMVVTADIPSERGPLGLRVLGHDKDFFSDKAPFTTLSQLHAAKKKVEATGKIWAVCYSERVGSESGVFAGQLIEESAIGCVLQVVGFGPHRLDAPSRPVWFFKKINYGGILSDIGSHQVEQFLFYAGAKDAQVVYSAVENFNHPEFPELEDFGEANLIADNGAKNYFRVDWFTPNGLRAWGDGRTFILGTSGYIEIRKYIDIAKNIEGDQLFLVNADGEFHISVKGKVGFPFFTNLILDCLHRKETAMSQAHAFKAAELSLLAQQFAEKKIQR